MKNDHPSSFAGNTLDRMVDRPCGLTPNEVTVLGIMPKTKRCPSFLVWTEMVGEALDEENQLPLP